MSPADRTDPETMSRLTNPREDIPLIVGVMAVLVIPALLTFLTIDSLPGEIPPTENPTPFGYTVSLSLFLLPVLALLWWHQKHPKHHVDQRALAGSALLIFLLGVILDSVFGYTFFTFENPGATVGLRLPSWDFETWRPVWGYLPIEEFGFYIFGGFFLIGSYLFADQTWLPDYAPEHREEKAREHHKLIHFSPVVAVVFVVLLAAGIAYKWYGPHEHNEGLPDYFIFIMVLGFLPSSLVFRSLKEFVNWRAFALSYFILLLVSLLWEGTMGVPYDWWNYRPEAMMGIWIPPWGNLPLEAVLLWIVCAWASVFAYEFLRVYHHMDRPIRHKLTGRPDGDD